MKAKNVMYAAVGAPIVAARALNTRLETLREELESRGEGLGERAQHLMDEWSREGREALGKVTDGKVVDDFAARVDFEQAREQVGRLRDQLEDMLATWRTSFRPEASDHAPAAPDPAAKAERARTEKAEAPVEEAWSAEEPTAAPLDEEATGAVATEEAGDGEVTGEEVTEQ